MNSEFVPEGLETEGARTYGHQPLYKDAAGDPFRVGQSYSDEPAVQLACAICGGRDFHVAQGEYFTAIRCVKCRWEQGVHDG